MFKWLLYTTLWIISITSHYLTWLCFRTCLFPRPLCLAMSWGPAIKLEPFTRRTARTNSITILRFTVAGVPACHQHRKRISRWRLSFLHSWHRLSLIQSCWAWSRQVHWQALRHSRPGSHDGLEQYTPACCSLSDPGSEDVCCNFRFAGPCEKGNIRSRSMFNVWYLVLGAIVAVSRRCRVPLLWHQLSLNEVDYMGNNVEHALCCSYSIAGSFVSLSLVLPGIILWVIGARRKARDVHHHRHVKQRKRTREQTLIPPCGCECEHSDLPPRWIATKLVSVYMFCMLQVIACSNMYVFYLSLNVMLLLSYDALYVRLSSLYRVYISCIYSMLRAA